MNRTDVELVRIRDWDMRGGGGTEKPFEPQNRPEEEGENEWTERSDVPGTKRDGERERRRDAVHTELQRLVLVTVLTLRKDYLNSL